jgi:hypothetical protein
MEIEIVGMPVQATFLPAFVQWHASGMVVACQLPSLIFLIDFFYHEIYLDLDGIFQ